MIGKPRRQPWWQPLAYSLAAGERWPISLRSSCKAEDVVYKGSLCPHVSIGHRVHLTLGQHRHRLHLGQSAPDGPEALKPKHGLGQALHTAVVLLDLSG